MSKFGLVPRPEVCQARAGTLALPLNTVWTFSDQTNFALETLLQTYRDMLQSYLPTQTGWQVIAADGTAHWHFLTDTNLSESGYRLEIGTDGIWLTSSGYHGAWAGCMTVLQLLHTHYQAETMAIILPALYISDQPRFVWRGLHLDVSRHFFPIPFLKRLLDQLALHKLNVFHWHLTDDQGWRLEIKRYPKLTEIGAWRERTVVGHPLFTQTPVYNDQPHGGFYTQEQARELVAYASARGITIVPEIEMPGHAAAALAAYPAYSCNEHPWHVSPTWGVHQATFCPSKPETYVFLENILTEVAALFPGEYLHIGGDECPKAPWAAHDLCRKTVQQLDLPDFEALQSHFIQKIGGILAKLGKHMVGWDEILEGGLKTPAVVMSWRGIEGGLQAAQLRQPVVMVPEQFVYLDYAQHTNALEPLAVYPTKQTRLTTAYHFEPIPPQLAPEYHAFVLGSQAQLWTEYIPTTEHAEYMLFPRLCALAEVFWSAAEQRDYADFRQRLTVHLERLKAWGIHYRPPSETD